MNLIGVNRFPGSLHSGISCGQICHLLAHTFYQFKLLYQTDWRSFKVVIVSRIFLLNMLSESNPDSLLNLAIKNTSVSCFSRFMWNLTGDLWWWQSHFFFTLSNRNMGESLLFIFWEWLLLFPYIFNHPNHRSASFGLQQFVGKFNS